MHPGPSRWRAPPQHHLPRGPTSQDHSRWGWRNFYLQLAAPALPWFPRQPLSHLLPQDRRELHLYGLTGTGEAP